MAIRKFGDGRSAPEKERQERLARLEEERERPDQQRQDEPTPR